MKEISLKRPAEKTGKLEMASPSKESYPSFTICDNVPDELMDCPMGKEVTAKIKKVAEEKRLGKDARKSVGFDVMSVMMDESKAKKSMADMTVSEIMKIQREKRKNKE